MKKVYLFLFFAVIATIASADVRLPKIFGDNMVLQREKAIEIWGWADPKEKISIQFNKQSKKVAAGKDGKWKISFEPEAPGGPYQLIVKGKNAITINNILVGDVWICSGQSNMEWTVRNTNNATQEIPQANFPRIRQFVVPRSVASQPQDDTKGGEWKLCSPETVADFTAVGYFFARELNRDLNIPIGLINTSWGGTHVETWTSRKAFESSDEFRSMIASMPLLNLDSLAKQKAATTLKRIEGIQGPLNNSDQVIQQWKENSFDDSNWKKMRVPGQWEQQEPGDFDGFVWFRKTFNVDAQDIGKKAAVEIGMIDDSDETYVNGVKVGGLARKPSDKRNYTIPPGTLRAGKNVIAVRVEDTGGRGGIYGSPDEVRITVGTSAQPLAGEWSYRIEGLSPNATSVGPNSYPTLLFNGMIHPIIQYPVKGAIWYQGESNAGRAYQYRKAFPLMITDWRQHWGQGDFPFYFVQLASYNAANGNSKNGSTWAELREAQTMTLSLPNTGMAVTTDIGESSDIHPRNKQDVGKRLAAIALSKTYGQKIVDVGPVFQSFKTDGNKVILTFSGTGSGLMVKDKYGYVKGFEIAGKDKQFQYAKAFIEGDKVVVYQDGVNEPVAVRFGWTDDAGDNNLFNKDGFPALPFRTDDWKGITEESKFRLSN